MPLPLVDRFLRALPPGRPGDPGLYGPGSATWRIHGEAVLMLGGPRALLMQIAHPAVAAAVARHSDFPKDAYRRLERTTTAMLALSFGDTDQAREAAAAITSVHRGVRGRASGRRYRAMDPDLLLWVHATLVDTSLEVYRRFLRPLGWEDAERYYAETKRQAVLLGIPAQVLPEGLQAFSAYVSATVSSLEASDDAKRLAPAILRPPLPIPLAPLARAQALVTASLLPPALRSAYGIPWDRRRAAATEAFETMVRTVAPRVPASLRRWPDVRAAERRTIAQPAAVVD